MDLIVNAKMLSYEWSSFCWACYTATTETRFLALAFFMHMYDTQVQTLVET